MAITDLCFTPFKTDVSGISIPEKFTFPIFYEPHELSLIATRELQDFLEQPQDWQHNFWNEKTGAGEAAGKMFGVLVVQNQKGELGYLSAFSGQIDGTMDIAPFVPAAYVPDFDKNYCDGQFKEFTKLSNQVAALEQTEEYTTALKKLEELQGKATQLLDAQRKKHKKQSRELKAQLKTSATTLNDSELQKLKALQHQQHLNQKFLYREYELYFLEKQRPFQDIVNSYQTQMETLTQQRRQQSLDLQDWIFKQYDLLNANGERKNVLEIFNELNLGAPPASTGDCAAPKLLQYAFAQALKPIALAEFWWGKSSKSQIRKHKQFYPACRSKCEPILGHMLQGLDVEDNPLLINPGIGKTMEVIYEDDAIIIVNKPEEFLSVEGKTIKDSVHSRLKEMYPDATGPILVHRLDMSTSGILVATKNLDYYHFIQEQFVNRTISKRYVALLDGVLEHDTGMIELPLRVDLDNRPTQLVCHEYGKSARTKYQVLERREKATLVHFYPITGRTHQLRVHAAHASGLNAPIVGDDLYGTATNRLHLHAEFIKFIHPITGKSVSFKIPAPF
ncbi:MAG: pseudouridine synthase [Nonlabens sp.]|uniref:RluA family pseudouridine synthase n=1 Tax=Nonlabens sp. TaxID=1888209 RepID=UPI003EF68F32